MELVYQKTNCIVKPLPVSLEQLGLLEVGFELELDALVDGVELLEFLIRQKLVHLLL